MSRENIRLVKPAPPPVHPDHVVCLCPKPPAGANVQGEDVRVLSEVANPGSNASSPIQRSGSSRKKLPGESGKGGLRRVGHFVARLDQLPIMESLEVQLEP